MANTFEALSIMCAAVAGIYVILTGWPGLALVPLYFRYGWTAGAFLAAGFNIALALFSFIIGGWTLKVGCDRRSVTRLTLWCAIGLGTVVAFIFSYWLRDSFGPTIVVSVVMIFTWLRELRWHWRERYGYWAAMVTLDFLNMCFAAVALAGALYATFHPGFLQEITKKSVKTNTGMMCICQNTGECSCQKTGDR